MVGPPAVTFIVTLSEALAQRPLGNVHSKTLFPKDKPLTVVVGLLTLAKVPLPETTDHVPTPTAGALAERVVVFEQMI